jgi:5-methylcytosine-specific restriction endonuclease McrA
MSNKQLVKQLKNKAVKVNLSYRLSKLTDNEIANLMRKTSDKFLTSKPWKELRKQAIEKYGSTCVYCGAEQIKFKRVNIDHIKPRKYFPHLALDITNLQPLCSPCNKRKGNKVI